MLCGQHCSTNVRGRLGATVKGVGMGNTVGPGETYRRCMFISRGVSTRDLTGVQCGKRKEPLYCACACNTFSQRILRKKQDMSNQMMMMSFIVLSETKS